MKLITLWEPWATLMAIGAKRIETRYWNTNYRGWVAIHSAKRFTADEDDLCWMSPFREALQSANVPVAPYRSGQRFQFPLGHIVAIAKVIDCLPTDSMICIPGVFDHYRELDSPIERAFGNYDSGRFGIVTSSVFRLPTPIAFRSRQGKLLDVDDEIVANVRRQYQEAKCPA